MHLLSKKHLFCYTIAFICLVLFFLPTGFEKPELTTQTLHCKAQVLCTDNEDIHSRGVVNTGTQSLVLNIENGKYKGDTVIAHNVLQGQMQMDVIYSSGEKVYALLKEDASKTRITSARVDDRYRLGSEAFLFLLFAFVLVCFAGITGFKALMSFVFTALAIWKLLLPGLLLGWSPLPLALGIVGLTTFVIIVLICGFSRKGMVALLGSLTGVVLTMLLSLSMNALFRIPGTAHAYADAILYAGFRLQMNDIFIACIFISSAGAVMDVAMDIAASQNELIEKTPQMSPTELMQCGIRIAKPVLGTMVTTLLFAYSGGFMFVMMMFMSKGTPLLMILNRSFIASELLHTLVGSFGLVMVAPATSVVGGYLFTHTKSMKQSIAMMRSDIRG